MLAFFSHFKHKPLYFVRFMLKTRNCYLYFVICTLYTVIEKNTKILRNVFFAVDHLIHPEDGNHVSVYVLTNPDVF